MSDSTEPKPFLGQKIVAVIFIINSIILLISNYSGIEDNTPIPSVGPAVIDFLIAISILRGSTKWISFAIFRIIFGMIVWGGISGSQGDYFTLVFQIIFGIGLLLLLVKEAGKARIISGSIISLCVLIFSVFGLQQVFYGHNPLNTAIINAQYNTENKLTGSIERSDSYYKIGKLVDNEWFIRPREEIINDNPLGDQWFVCTKYDAHILIIAESVNPALSLNIDAYKDAILKNIKATKTSKVSDITDITVSDEKGYIVNATSTQLGLNLKYKYALFTEKYVGIQIICFSEESVFKHVESDFDKIIQSFDFLDSLI